MSQGPVFGGASPTSVRSRPAWRNRLPSLPSVRCAPHLPEPHPGVHWDRLLFRAKGVGVDGVVPLTRRRLDFDEARLAVSPSTGSFRATVLLPDTPIRTFGGRFTTGHG